MRAIFLLTLLLGAVSADENFFDGLNDFGILQEQPVPTGEPVTYKADDSTASTQTPETTTTASAKSTFQSTATTPKPESYKPEDDTTKSPSEYVTEKSTEPTPASPEHPIEYVAGRRYLYHYEAQILTGNPEMSNQYTGYQMHCRVLLQVLRNRRVRMRITYVDFGQTNRVMPMRRPVVILPRNFFRRIVNRVDFLNIVRMLRLPVSFKWTETGWVKELRVSKRDTFWSLNIKKGMLTMLNLNLRINPADINQKTNGIFKRTKYYEDGIDGHCKANYEYRRFPYSVRTRGRLISITKTRDLNDCKQKPWFNHMLFLPSQCSESRSPLFAKTKTSYTLSVIRKKFFLRNIRTVSKYSYNRRDIKDGSVTSFVVQRIIFLRRSLSSEEHSKDLESVPHPKGLMMVMPIPEWGTVKRNNRKVLLAARYQAIQILRGYIRDDLDMYDSMRNFIQLVRRLNTRDILKLMQDVHQEPEMKSIKNKDLLYNILSKVATKEVTEAILVIIKKRSQPDETTSMLVSRLSGMSFVNSGLMIKKMMKVALAMKSPKQKETYKSLLYTIGKLINTHYTMPIPVPPGKNDFILSRQAIKRFYQDLLRKRSTVLKPVMHKLVVVGSLGNCGLVKPCLDLLEPYVQIEYKDRRRIPRVIRDTAIYGLNVVAPKAPWRVRKIVLPIIYDVREDVELRMTAYITFMATKPDLSDLKLISQFLTAEPVRQLRAFIATHLRALSLTKERCLAPLALNASRILREMPPEIANPEGLQFSRVAGLRLPIEEKIAIMIATVKITPKNFLPREMDLGIFARALGLNIGVGKAAIRAEDAQRLLDRLLGPDGTARMVKSLKKLLRPIVGRSKIDTDYLAAVAMYQGLYGMTGLTREVTDTLKKGLIPLPRDLYRLAIKGGSIQRRMETLSFVDMVSKIPTTFGVPMTVNHTMTAHLKLKAVVVSKPGLMSPKATVGLRAKVDASYRHELRAGPDMTIIRSFVSAMSQGHLPRVTGGIRIGWIKPRSTPRFDRLLYRVNLERPAGDKKVLHLSGRLTTAQWSRVRPWKPVLKHMQHRSLPVPRTTTLRVATSRPLGLALDLQHRVLNFTGILPLLKVPLFAPRDIKIILRRNKRVGAGKGVDFTGQVLLTRSNLRSILGDYPPWGPNATSNTDDLFSRKETDDEKLWQDTPQGSHYGPQPTEQPPQMFTSMDENGKSSQAFFYEGPGVNDTKNYNLTDQPEWSSNMTDDESKAFFASQRRLRSLLMQVVLRLDNLPLNGNPKINLGNKNAIRRCQLAFSPLRKGNGFGFHVLSLRFKPSRQSVLVHGIAVANKAIMQARFHERRPLTFINNMLAHTTFVIRVNGRNAGYMHNLASMSKMWKSNIQRIIRNKNKQLPVFREIRRCLNDLRGKRYGTPACYQAWKDINALSKIRSFGLIFKSAPQWLKQSSVLLFNYLRSSQIDALRVSKYVRPTGDIRITGDWELSPYDQRLVSGYQRIMSIWDRYVNARLSISRRNSIAESPSTNLVSNIFDGLYPARCEVVRRGHLMSWRTFDNVQKRARSRLAARSGRVVLVQDLKKRLLVTEQKSRSYRITHIRLRHPWEHVMIVVRARGRVKIPRVFFRGKFRRLPFRLYSRRRQLMLVVYRDPTPRSRWSLTAWMPKVGAAVRTNPAVSTEISVSPFFHSNVRGICGDFDGEKMDESKGPLCRAVFPNAQRFLNRHVTILRGYPSLKAMERIPSMRKFLLAAQCPDHRYYPWIIR